MSFANPVFFWAFLSLIPLIAIYLLKVSPVRKPTTAYFLWDNIFKEKRSQTLFQRLRDLLSLLLMAMVFACIVLAMASPFWKSDDRKDLILLIDNSASMNASDGGSTRLEKAKSVAADIVRALNGSQRCSIATVSNETVYRSNLTDNPRNLLEAIDSIEPTPLPFRASVLDQFQTDSESGSDSDDSTDSTDDSDSTNETKTESTANHRVILITDGCLKAPESVELLKVGSSTQGNVGIVACDLKRLPGNRAGLFFKIGSSHKKTVSVDLSVTQGDAENLVRVIPLEIKPGINPAEVFELEAAESGKWSVSLDVDDSLEDDNHAFLTLPPHRPIKVSVSAEDRFFFENSVVAFQGNGGLLKLVEPGEGVLSVGSGESLSSAAGNLLIFQPSGESVWWSDLGEEFESAAPQVLDEEHPVVRFLDAAAIPYIGARKLTAPPGAEVWVASEDGTPLIYRSTRSGQSAVIVNMDPVISEFYFSAFFPVLVYSTATHLSGRTEEVQSTYATSQLATIPGVQEGEKTTITFADQESIETTESSFGPLVQTGYYELDNENGDWQVGCSLLSADETLLDNSKIKDTSKPISRGWSPVGLLSLIAIVVITLESVLYQRRKVG